MAKQNGGLSACMTTSSRPACRRWPIVSSSVLRSSSQSKAMSEIPKTYEPQAVEEKWYQFWLDQKCFVANVSGSRPSYSIVIPPPNVTGMLHMGHVLNNTIQDTLARKARMDNKEVLWLPGTDHAGIAT